MLIEKKQFWLCLVLLASSCKGPYIPPPITIGVYLNSGKVMDANNSIPSMKSGLERDIKPSDIVISPENFDILYNYGANLRSKLIKCENSSR